MVEEKNQFLGIVAYPGIIYAKTKKLETKSYSELPTRSDLTTSEREEDIQKFLASIQSTERELDSIIQETASSETGLDLIEILASQKDILQDPMFKEGVTQRIRELGESVGLALINTVQRIYDDFMNLEDEFFRERADHIQDIGKRVSSNLYRTLNRDFEKKDLVLEEPCILVAKDFSPSELIGLDKSQILGIATDHGGKTGHMAIIARNYGIPTIVGLKNLSTYLMDGEFILLDAERGFVKRNPSIEETKFFGIRSSLPLPETNFSFQNLKTNDGTRIVLKANLETEDDCGDVLDKGAEGIGLYRSEILYLQFKNHTPTEDEQFQVYKKILKAMDPLPVVIRAFDIGADKYEIGSHEDNPFLGNRGIRYLLRHPGFFKEQLRALYRASSYGNLQILIPMITTISEIRDSLELIEETKEELESEGVHIARDIPLGIMVETPACAIGLESYIRYVDFISVGTNDLLQYTMAVERNNYAISDLYNPFHASFLTLLERIAQVANKKKIPVSICGEVATDPDMTGILLAMGYRDLSIAPPFFVKIQERIRNMKLRKEKAILKKVKALATEDKFYEINMLLKQDALSV